MQNRGNVMPVYEYCCQKCGHCFDALQGLSDVPLEECPQCKELSLEKLISAPMFQLKGTGWYETDFKKKKEAPAASKESAPAETKTDTPKSDPVAKKKEGGE
jgi:putative FmdB family regulatory protein